jgi:hypothetical protein
MPSKILTPFLFLALILAWRVGTANAQPMHKAVKRTPVEVWCGGDDGLTIRLRDSSEKAFKSSADFIMSSGKKPGTLIATIPTHVEWQDIDKKTKVFYTVEFSSTKRNDLGVSKGSCMDDEFEKCANQIVNDARIAAAKMEQ